MFLFNFPFFMRLSKKGVECAADKLGNPNPNIPAKGAYRNLRLIFLKHSN